LGILISLIIATYEYYYIFTGKTIPLAPLGGAIGGGIILLILLLLVLREVR